MYIGYARISTHEQNLALQQDALTHAGCQKIIVDRVSGTVADRPGLATIKELLRAGDTHGQGLLYTGGEFRRLVRC